MTRNEANQLVMNRWAGITDCFGFVEALSALGILKLDEVVANQKFKDAICELRPEERDVSTLLYKLDAAGLKIVEK